MTAATVDGFSETLHRAGWSDDGYREHVAATVVAAPPLPARVIEILAPYTGREAVSHATS